MAKQSREFKNTARSKRESELAERLTFLEKLVLRVLDGRQVPAESGVRFAISSKAKDDGICLVFLVDDQESPIVKDGPRPDYLVVHLSHTSCLMTIVEMKGTEAKNVEHGIEQIQKFAQTIKAEMAKCLPGSWRKTRIQGLLLTPFNAQINRKKIEDAKIQGIEILPLQYDHQAELYPYISKPISRTSRYAHEKLPRDKDNELNAVERLIATGKLERRDRDEFFTERRGGDDNTFFLSFRQPGDPTDAQVSLSTNERDAVLRFSPAAKKCQEEVLGHLLKHGLQCPALRYA